jgi:type II secretory pathway component PulF
MAVFEYKAVQANGTSIQGTIDAAGRQDAARLIEARGLTPVRLVESSSPAKNGARTATKLPATGQFAWKSTRVPFAALEDFTRSLSSLLSANVPLSRALTILYKETSHPAAAAKWRELHELVIDGVPLAEAMGRSPDVFPRVYVAMVEAGEAGGFLDVVLAQIADFQAQEKEMRAKVMSALMYPAVLLCLAIGVLIFLLVFFIPRFQTLFEGFDAALPALTLIIVGVSDFVRSYGFYLLAAIVAAVWFGRGLRRKAAAASGSRGFCGRRSSARSPHRSPWRASAACSAHCSAPVSRSSAHSPSRGVRSVTRRWSIS